MIELPSPAFNALEHLVVYGPTFCKEIPVENYVWFLHLKEKGLAKMELPDPNFLYQLPPEKRSWYQMKLTGEGLAQYHLIKEARAAQDSANHKPKAESEQKPVDNRKDKLSCGDIIGIVGVVVTIISIIVAVFQ